MLTTFILYYNHIRDINIHRLLNYPRVSRQISNNKTTMGGDSSALAGDIKAEVDAAIDSLNQRLREVNRKV
jgi:hypothetical protein